MGSVLDDSGRISYHRSMTTILSEKGQITLPKAFRTSLGLKTGTELEISEVNGHLVLRKLIPSGSENSWRGKGQLPPGFTSGDDYLTRTRG